MKTLRERFYLTLFIGTILGISASCAPPPLEIFLSPNPDFQKSEAQSKFGPQRQEPVQPLISPMQDLVVEKDTHPGKNRIVSQLLEALAEAQAHVHAGEARLREQNLLEAVREFERARILIAKDVDPALQYIQQTARIQGGVNILSDQRIQRIRTQRAEMLSRINRSYDFRTMYDRQRELDQMESLREKSKPVLQPVLLDKGVTQIQSSEVLVKQQPKSLDINLTLLTEDNDRYIARFRQRRNEFRECLIRANQYFPTVTSILSAAGVPEDLAYVALIESGFQPSVVDSSGKAGLWQLSHSTARSYGLEVSSNKDERKDIEATTRVFAQYISHLHRRFRSWELAILGYEMGEQRLQNIINRVGSYDLQIIKQQLGKYSQEREFLAKLAAVITIAKNPRAYGFDVNLPNISGQVTVQVKKSSPSVSIMTEPPAVTLY